MMTGFGRGLCAIFLILGSTLPASADDGLSAFQNGALMFGKSETIAMTDETLSVSASEITADFHFLNTGSKVEKVTVAFPIPDVDTAETNDFYFPVENSDNFVGFTTVVDGKPVANGLEQRAFTPEGKDVTDLLKSFDIPLVRLYGANIDLIAALPEKSQQALLAAGAIVGEADDRSPQWITKSKFYFEQSFEPGKPVHIVHRYKPSLDTSNMSFFSGDMTPSAEQTRLYCLTDKVKTAVAALEKRKAKAGEEFPYATQTSIGYVLWTAKTWSGPIGHYHLIIDKQRPGVIASFCGDAKQTSPTRFEFEQDNYVPDRDLAITLFE